MYEKITSSQNPKIKALKKLEKAGERREQNLVLIEGLRETVLAHRAGYAITSLFICPDILTEQQGYSVSELPTPEQIGKREAFGIDETHPAIPTYYISQQVYQSFAYRESTEGVIATAHPRSLALLQLQLPANPLVLVIEGVEKPGNLGAMLRTCDAAAVDAVIICNPKTDVYNPNVIRSSVGTVFTNQLAVCNTTEAIAFLKQNNIHSFAAEPGADTFYFNSNFKQSTAIVVGTEATGLSTQWIDAASGRIKIPMLGKIDSLNVSVSAAILLFEARRQRV